MAFLLYVSGFPWNLNFGKGSCSSFSFALWLSFLFFILYIILCIVFVYSFFFFLSTLHYVLYSSSFSLVVAYILDCGSVLLFRKGRSSHILGKLIMIWGSDSGENCRRAGIRVCRFSFLSRNDGKWKNKHFFRWGQRWSSENAAFAWVYFKSIWSIVPNFIVKINLET